MIGRFVGSGDCDSRSDTGTCPSLRCSTACRYGYVPDDNGCQTCECLNACVTGCGGEQICAMTDLGSSTTTCTFPFKLCCPPQKTLISPFYPLNYCSNCFPGCYKALCPPGKKCCPDYFGCPICIWPIPCTILSKLEATRL
ncbi:hypothetical protein HELRODRAFT_173742 [Helobdella robusta]|uniref:Antistasin-like domain-containing protein n=1 Tax=Helobdella robusta TaxID=6412 RepID=T1F767_HELRO|nr:hypothetical protein HELRODRAFT_173742 [Helobdella robusta]ESO03446.1 hypothetical protein HELRODRAFT_173742 [Helobdella robusta]